MRTLTPVIVTAILVAGLQAQTPPSVQARAQLVQQSKPEAVRLLGQLGKLVTPENHDRMGFANVEQARSATLGEPLQVYKVWLNELKTYQAGTDPAKLLHGGEELMYPVVAGNEVRSSVTVAKIAGQWKQIAVGKTELMRLVGQAKQEVSSQKGFAELHFIVRIPAMNLAFIGYRNEGKLMLVPLLDDPRFDFKTGTVIPASEVFKKIAPAAREQSDMPS